MLQFFALPVFANEALYRIIALEIKADFFSSIFSFNQCLTVNSTYNNNLYAEFH